MLTIGALTAAVGRVRLLIIFSVAMAAAAAGLSVCSIHGHDHVMVYIIVFLGGFGLQPNVAPQMVLEHAMLGDAATPDNRNMVFARYNLGE